jgi:serine phosphatase RsbU (regulator of sigma subunit)/pSer/pThr/pTyr-binding forkhead associated (FHA) protein
MTPERWPKVRAVLAEALELWPKDRAAFLDRACDGNQALRREVETLLSSDENVRTNFLQSDAFSMALGSGAKSEAALPMSDIPVTYGTTLEVISPDRSRRSVEITESPFLIGRGGGNGNHLQLLDQRISRQSAAIIREGDGYCLEDRGQRHGIFVNGKKIERIALQHDDVITFGFDDFYTIIFRCSGDEVSLRDLLARIGTPPRDESSSGSGGLQKLNVLLQATSLLHSQLPLESVLGSMLDHAIAITDADRGLLLEADACGSLRVRLARGSGGVPMPQVSVAPSQTALRQALEQKSSIITEDVSRAEAALQMAQSIVAQSLRAVIAIPLYINTRQTGASESVLKAEHEQLLGIIYLDSRRPTAFSKLDREILDALAVEAASILDNARLVERERQRQRLEQELNIARDIQQALIPHGLRDFPYFAVSGIHTPCHAVGGDYFDVFPLDEHRTAILVADVAGKGLGAALLATMLQGALSGMTIGTDPVRLIQHINRFLCEHAQIERYATMFLGILHAKGELVHICAGHPSPLILRRSQATELVARPDFPIGLMPDANFAATTTKLEDGDTLVLFTDGVTEAANPDQELFGEARLRDLLARQEDASLEQLQKAVLQSIASFTSGASQSDDITLLLVRYRAA